MKQSDRDARRKAARYLLPLGDRFKDWYTIWFYRITVIVLIILLIKYGGGVLNTNVN